MTGTVLASYFNRTLDPQRGRHWNSSTSNVLELVNSVVEKDIKIKVFHDCFESPPEIKNCEWIKTDEFKDYVPSVRRWFVYKKYFKNLEEKPSFLFMVDSTDVILLQNPFPFLNHNTLYVGNEYSRNVSCKWLSKKRRYFYIDDYNDIISKFKNTCLLNAGICGGDFNIISKFLNKLTDIHKNYNHNKEISLDMPIYNYTILKFFSENFTHGDFINTGFKDYTANNYSWWKHK